MLIAPLVTSAGGAVCCHALMLSRRELQRTLHDAFMAKDQKLMDELLIELVLAGETVERLGRLAVMVLERCPEDVRDWWYSDCACGLRHLGPEGAR